MITKEILVGDVNITPILNVIFAFVALVLKNVAPEVSDVLTEADEIVDELQ